jgi:hypothetical protein
LATRLAPVALLFMLLSVAACGAGLPATGTVARGAGPGRTTTAPSVTVAPSAEPPTTRPNEGDVEGVQEGRPELAIEALASDVLEISVTDTTAKAWRISVSGPNPHDRLELVVETSDVTAGIEVDEIVGDQVISTNDLTRMPDDPTVAAGGCHRTLGICYASDGIKLTPGHGTLMATFRFRDPNRPIAVTGATAGWPAEPFILGDWRESQTFKSWDR